MRRNVAIVATTIAVLCLVLNASIVFFKFIESVDRNYDRRVYLTHSTCGSDVFVEDGSIIVSHEPKLCMKVNCLNIEEQKIYSRYACEVK